MKKNRILILTIFFMFFGNLSFAKERIHIITMSRGGTDAIILESDGKFAMIDTGEDDSYPDGSNARYPFRSGISKKEYSIEDRLFKYIDKLGIKKLEFVILTHIHSDHIGNAPKLLEKIPTDRIYFKKYSDDRITDSRRLWDNLYGYEKTLQSAKKNNVKIIQDITNPNIKLGNLNLQLYNYKNEYDSNGNLKKVYDDNLNSILTVVNYDKLRLFFGGDLENGDGREDFYGPIIGKVDFMKFNHHFDTQKANSKNFIKNLRPKYMLKTNVNTLREDYLDFMKSLNIELKNAGRLDVEALVFELDKDKGIIDKTDEIVKYGFYKENGILKFKDWNGNFVNGFFTHLDNLYKFNPDGTVAIGWVENTYYADKNGAFLEKQFKEINGKLYYFKKYGSKAVDWLEINGKWYYFGKDGVMQTNRWVGDYYVGTDGIMLTDTITPDGYHVDKNGKYYELKWFKVNNKWKLRIDGKVLKNSWYYYDKNWYYLGNDEVMFTGWNKIDGYWYYFNEDGVMQSNKWIGDYYLGSNGAMLTNTVTPDGYHVDENGKYYQLLEWFRENGNWKLKSDGKIIKESWIKYKENWYYLDDLETMVIGWKEIKNHWYYFNEDGIMQSNKWIGYYYLGSNGYMLTNTITPDGYHVDENGKYYPILEWFKHKDKWKLKSDGKVLKSSWAKYDGELYYLDKDETMVVGWKKINNYWYYFNEDGVMQSNKWIGNYYLGKEGKMLSNTITPDGFYVNENGEKTTPNSWVKKENNWKYLGSNLKFVKSEWIQYKNETYYIDENEIMVTGWKLIEDNWHYFEETGEMVRNRWIGDYYLDENGIMLTNTTTPDRHKVDENGKKQGL